VRWLGHVVLAVHVVLAAEAEHGGRLPELLTESGGVVEEVELQLRASGVGVELLGLRGGDGLAAVPAEAKEFRVPADGGLGPGHFGGGGVKGVAGGV